MEQERHFERLWRKNEVIKHQIARRMLQDIQRQKFEHPGVKYMCYCQDAIPEEGVPEDVITCSHRDCDHIYFHKPCVKKQGVEKVSRWYCTTCEKEMKILARQKLRDMGYMDVPAEDAFDAALDEKKLKDMLKMPDGVMIQIKNRVKHLGGKVEGVSVMAFEKD